MKAFSLPVLLFSIIYLESCNLNYTRTNSEEDKKDAEVVANQFFDCLKKQEYQNTFSLFSKEFLDTSFKEELYKVYDYGKRNLGTLRETSLAGWETNVVNGTDASGTYALKYKNSYDSGIAVETIRLMKDKDDQIKIIYYHINSDLFYKK